MSTAVSTVAADAGTSTGRIGSLDVLRGIALLGMFLVHFNDQTLDDRASGVAAVYRQAVALLFEERFWAMFGILFGVGFALQLQRADARGRPFVAMYLRRLAALAALGLLSHACFGYHVLFEYAMWGVPLLLVRRWSIRTLVIALVISAGSWSLYGIARASYGVATVGEASYRSELLAEQAAYRAFRQGNEEAQRAPEYGTVFKARLRHMVWYYRQPFSFLPVNTFTLFLIGVIGFRLGLFDKPEQHRRLILAISVFGLASWATANWFLPGPGVPAPSDGPFVRAFAIAQLERGVGLIRSMWLALTYIGIVLLLVARDRAWLRHLAPFGWTGRMALTTYIVQVALLDLLFTHYGLGLTVAPLQALAAGLALFTISALLSRWWLSRFRFGPLEWLWRSITYARLQPLRSAV
jgi:uncharacterized protein